MQKNIDMQTPPTAPGYETRDVNTRGILYFVIGLFVLLVFSLVSMRWLFGYFSETQPLGPAASPFTNSRNLPMEPRLQIQPEQDLIRVRTTQEDALNSYGWVDRANGIVRIPIDRAMDLIVERSLPVRRQFQLEDRSAGDPKAGKEPGQ